MLIHVAVCSTCTPLPSLPFLLEREIIHRGQPTLPLVFRGCMVSGTPPGREAMPRWRLRAGATSRLSSLSWLDALAAACTACPRRALSRRARWCISQSSSACQGSASRMVTSEELKGNHGQKPQGRSLASSVQECSWRGAPSSAALSSSFQSLSQSESSSSSLHTFPPVDIGLRTLTFHQITSQNITFIPDCCSTS